MTLDTRRTRFDAGQSTDILDEISRVVSNITGVQLGERQRTMVQSRLSKRIAQLGLHGLDDYRDFYERNRESESKALVSLLTTHHTYFFRESSHFEYMIDKALPAIVEDVRRRGDKTIRIWSAACSKGHEAYTLAMLLATHLPRIAPDLTFEIHGTDVDPESIAIALSGVYHYREIKEIPTEYLRGNWSRGTGDIAQWAKVKATLKKHCRFELGNLLDLSTMSSKRDFDMIFCRNVFIYFTPSQVKSVTQGLLKKLLPGGLLFIGISESLNGMDLPVATQGPSIYRKAVAGAIPAAKLPIAPLASPVSEVMPSPIKVLCVDDSASILAVLKRVLTRENGFQVVGTATNGIEAAKMLKTLNVDAMTLDIHMPEQGGLEYLQKNHTSQHPPVIMVSSVAREEASLAQRCLSFGAVDYVEKPTLANMAERGEEIRNKLKSAVRSRTSTGSRDLVEIDREFSANSAQIVPERTLRVIAATYADRQHVMSFLRELSGPQPHTLLLVEGADGGLNAFAASLGLDGPSVFVGDLSRALPESMGKFAGRQTSVVAFGNLSPSGLNAVAQWPKAQVLVEDLGQLRAVVKREDGLVDVVPYTSFAYMSNSHLSRKP